LESNPIGAQTNKQSKERSKMKIKPSKQKNKNKKENTTPTPKLSKAWANSREVIFPM